MRFQWCFLLQRSSLHGLKKICPVYVAGGQEESGQSLYLKDFQKCFKRCFWFASHNSICLQINLRVQDLKVGFVVSFNIFEVWERNSMILLHTLADPKITTSCPCDQENKALRSLGSNAPSRVCKGLIPLSLALARYHWEHRAPFWWCILKRSITETGAESHYGD